MKNMLATLLLVTAMLLPISAEATDYQCGPNGFTLQGDSNGLNLSGTLQMPAAGYKYSFDAEDADSSPSVMDMTLNVESPSGEVVSELTPLNIDEYIDTEGSDVRIVKVEIVKEFMTGPGAITCRALPALQPHD